MKKQSLLVSAVLATSLLAGCVEETGKNGRHHSGLTPGSNEQAYFDDGCAAGARDGRAGMSRAPERHSEQYDRRFEPFFRQGYRACWAANR